MKPTFPVKVRRGSVVVKIYRQQSAGVFTVAYYEDGQRRRSSFGDLAAAREEADKVADRLSRHAGSSLTLAGNGLIEYARAQECLNPLGVRLDIAANEYCQAVSILNGKGTLLEAVRHFATSCTGEITPTRERNFGAARCTRRPGAAALGKSNEALIGRLGWTAVDWVLSAAPQAARRS